MNKPLVSFVVLSWNTLEDTKLCIENLKSIDYKNTEIIVVDNGSTDGSKKFLKSLKTITYVSLPQNTGFTGGQIEALKHCKGEFVALINSDAVLAKDWITECLKVFVKDNKAAAVGGKVFEWNEHSKVFDTTSPFYTYQKIDMELGYAETKRAGESVVEVDSISGAAVMIKRSVIDTVGYFDNRFFAYFEETDLFARFQRAGYKIIYQPSALAWHQIAKSTKSKPYFYLYQMHRNRFLFGFKNSDNGFSFAKRYFVDGIGAHTRFIKHKSLDDEARIKAFWWNLFHIFPSIAARKEIQSLGKTYDNVLLSHHEGDDITIVIPSYNYAKYLPEAIESARTQDLKPWKIIVIDDGSTDESVLIAKKYKDIEVISKQNEGVVLTKNLGLALSTTSWTLFLDADDVLEKNYLSSTYDTATKNNSSVVYTDMKFTGSKSGTFEAKPYALERLLEGNFIHNSALISTTLLKNAGGYKIEMAKGYEDWELYLTLAEMNGKFSYNNNTSLEYRQHEGALSRNGEAIDGAELLWATARSLHAGMYERARKKKLSYRKLLRQAKKHPLLPIICIVLIPYSLIRGMGGYFRYTRYSYEHGLRTYIHSQSNPTKKKTQTIEERVQLLP